MSTFFVAMWLAVIIYLAERMVALLLKFFGFYAIIREREARVYVLFGDIVGIIQTPGFHFLWVELGWRALFVNWLGTSHRRSMSLDQVYLRSIPVNSEEGTPMGIGVWYEMYITDPVAHIFKNVDPEGSLTVSVKNETIKNLSNLPLAEMLSERHKMSLSVRQTVSPESEEWGYHLGSVYIRKVHFRDLNMIKQIEEKVVNQLRQVTSAIEQDGKNQVNIITSRAEQESSIEFAKAGAVRPAIVGNTIQKIAQDPEVLASMFEILETQRVAENPGELTLVSEGSRNDVLTQLIAAGKKETIRKQSV